MAEHSSLPPPRSSLPPLRRKFTDPPTSRRTGRPAQRVRHKTSPETPISILREAAEIAKKNNGQG